MKEVYHFTHRPFFIAKFAQSPQGPIVVRNISGFGQYNLADNASHIRLADQYYQSLL